MNTSRREFLSTTAAGALACLPGVSALAAGGGDTSMQVAGFTKPYQRLSFEELAREVAASGLDGIEAPVRPGGHIEPERVEEELPRMVEALAQVDRKIMILTSGINSIDDPHAERVLRTAQQLGIPQFRLAYYRYPQRGVNIDHTLAEVKSQLTDLAAMCGEIGIQGIYQNHSGSSIVGATIWDIYQSVRDLPADSIGIAFDIRHAVTEAGMSWPTLYERVKDRLASVYVKDFLWDGPKVKNVPLGEGRVTPRFFKMLAADNYAGPFSLHIEYFGKVSPAEAGAVTKAFQTDLDVLKKWWRMAQS